MCSMAASDNQTADVNNAPGSGHGQDATTSNNALSHTASERERAQTTPTITHNKKSNWFKRSFASVDDNLLKSTTTDNSSNGSDEISVPTSPPDFNRSISSNSSKSKPNLQLQVLSNGSTKAKSSSNVTKHKESSSSDSSLNCSKSSLLPLHSFSPNSDTNKKTPETIRSIKYMNKKNKKSAKNMNVSTDEIPFEEDDDNSSGHSSTNKERLFSKSHQKRFHRRFPSVDPDEQLIDWFSCALIADILLQGYLYISETYFAFYSNIFGYKTQLLIPIRDVVSVTKERTIRIFPNAVGISTEETKYSFGSLLSRESTFKLLHEVWRSALAKKVSSEPYYSSLPLERSSASDCELRNNNRTNAESAKESEASGSTLVYSEAIEEAGEIKNSRARTATRSRLLGEHVKPVPLPEALIASALAAELPASDSEREGSSNEARSVRNHHRASSDSISKDSHGLTTDGLELRAGGPWGLWCKLCLGWESAPRSTRLLFFGVVMLAFLLLSAALLLYRVNVVRGQLDGVVSNQSELRTYGNGGRPTEGQVLAEVQRVVKKLQNKLSDMSEMNHSLEELLEAAQHIPDFCCH